MARLLIVYGTTEGHTRTIAGAIAETARAEGHTAHVIDATLDPATLGYDAVAVAAPIHQGKHPSAVVHFARRHREALDVIPTALFSVSLAAAIPAPEEQAEAQGYVDRFVEATGWRPGMTFLTAGALLYTQYDFLKRLLMKLIARHHGQSTDTAHDHELTDWVRLRHDTLAFLARLPAPAAVPV
jgi:menaquinone-dependent protoporphyrinogen oxidase